MSGGGGGWYYSGLRLVSVQLALDCQLELSLAISSISGIIRNIVVISDIRGTKDTRDDKKIMYTNDIKDTKDI